MEIMRYSPGLSRYAALRYVIFIASLLLVGLGSSRPAWGQIIGNRQYPSQGYFQIFPLLFDGEIRDAQKEFLAAGRGSLKNGVNGYWVDSICYHAMVGECHYQMGEYDLALQRFNSALELYLQFNDWMVPVQMPPQIRTENQGRILGLPWGQSTRGATIGRYPDTALLMIGQIDASVQLRQGGVVTPAAELPLVPQEIVRCTCLSLRRRRELLGQLAQFDPLSGKLVAALARRPAPPNHWSEVWVEVQLGLAYAAAGKIPQAKTALQQSFVAAGQFDHSMTCIALLELGRIAMEEGDHDSAQGLLAEASYSAAQFGDNIVLEESLRLGSVNHLIGNRPDYYPPLQFAIDWAARGKYRFLQASLLVQAAENACVLGRPQDALASLDSARAVIGKRSMGLGRLGARYQFIQALANFQVGNVEAGNNSITTALAFAANGGSTWLYQMSLADNMFRSGNLTPRIAMDLYALVLRDPTTADWTYEPFESLAALTIPHGAIFEHWFDLAISREIKQHELALEISDRTRRHRFLSAQYLGGRVLNLRWLLEAPRELLTQAQSVERQNLLVRFPEYDAASKQSKAIRDQLAAIPLVSDDPEQRRKQETLVKKLQEVSLQQEMMLNHIALRREGASLVFPPVRKTSEIQAALPPGHALLSFFVTEQQYYAFLMTKDQYGYWPNALPPKALKFAQGMLRDMGNYDGNKEVTLADVAGNKWQKNAQGLLKQLQTDARAKFADLFEEIVIVPDGVTWYIPFEALPLDESKDSPPLISKVRIRYAPSVGLAVGDKSPRRKLNSTAVILGKLSPQEEKESAQAAFDDYVKIFPGANPLSQKLPFSSNVLQTLVDTLIVQSEITPPDKQHPSWYLASIDRGDPAGTLDAWMALPWGSPEVMLMPGFRSAAENTMKKTPKNMAGSDLFQASMGLMATGTHTILISRWRMGGRTCQDLLREFAQEIPNTSAADAWQRSLSLAWESPLNPDQEPRLKREGKGEFPTAKHPIFWAGYMILDVAKAPDNAGIVPADEILKEKKNPGQANPPKPPAGNNGNKGFGAANGAGDPAAVPLEEGANQPAQGQVDNPADKKGPGEPKQNKKGKQPKPNKGKTPAKGGAKGK